MSSVLEDSNHVAGSFQENCEVEPDIKFYVEFRRHDNYLGEYGFDWMRSDYEYISKDYKKLKSEYSKSTKEPKENSFRYTSTKVEGKEYFVPWLSLLPLQTVELILKVFLLEGTVTPGDKIILSKSEDNVIFSRPEISLESLFPGVKDEDIKDHKKKIREEVEEDIREGKENLKEKIKDQEELIKIVKITTDYNDLKEKTAYSNFDYTLYEASYKKNMVEAKKILLKSLNSRLEDDNKEFGSTLTQQQIENIIERRIKEKGLFEKEIKLTATCVNPLVKHALITVRNEKNRTPVGYLKVLQNSNHKDFEFEITPIRVLRSRTKIVEDGKQVLVADDIYDQDKKTIDDKVFGGVDESKGNLQELENYLNKESLNQASLQCNFSDVVNITIDEARWIDDKKIVTEEGLQVFDNCHTDDFRKELLIQHPQLNKRRGVFLFLAPLKYEKEDEIGAYANMDVIDARTCVVFETNLNKPSTFSHEIAHVLGLEHSFLDEAYSNMDDRKISMISDGYEIKRIEKDIINEKAKEAEYKGIISEYDDLENEKFEIDTACNARGSILNKEFSRRTEILECQKQIKNDVLKAKEKLRELHKHWQEVDKYRSNLNRRNYYEGWNPHKFILSNTENIMDYNNNRISFYKFQWLAMQNDVKKYYSKK